MKTIKEHLAKIKDTYNFYFVLCKKFEIKQARYLALKEKANERFKKVYLRDLELNKLIRTSNFMAPQIKYAEEKVKLQDELTLYQQNFKNIKNTMKFNQEIIFKCIHFLLIIDFTRIKILNISAIKNVENKIFNQKGVIEIPKSQFLIKKAKKDKLDFKILDKVMDKIISYYQKMIFSRKRLYDKKNEITSKYQEIVRDNLKKSEEVKSETLVINRNVKDLQDAENMKQIKEGEDKKLRIMSLQQDIIDINKQYLLLTKPYNPLLNIKIIKIIKNTGNKTKKKDTSKNKLVLIPKFIEQYTAEEQKILQDKISKIDSLRVGSMKLNSKRGLFNFNPRFTRKSLIE